jgi:glutamate dehydrogenase/leucine dehydrogenase
VLGGIDGRIEATGYGAAQVAALAWSDRGASIEGARVAIQGFGNVGRYAALRLAELDAKVIAVSDACDNAELLTAETDLLIPAAIESVITDDNAGQIRARMIVEAANLPVTRGANRQLREAGVEIVPDLLVNAGGVTVWYFE